MSKKNACTTPQEIEDLILRLNNARKYKGIGIPHETLNDLVMEAMKTAPDIAKVEKIVRLKLHNLSALYLGDPDYESLTQQLSTLNQDAGTSMDVIKELCLQVLSSHASTAERILILTEFYERIFAVTGKPASILDLACGLNPFTLPWMNLDPSTQYYAYDLHQPRIKSIAALLELIKQPGDAIHQDILVHPPGRQADIAFFFKEAHRFEQRQKGCNRAFFSALPVKFLLVSLPTSNLTGKRDMLGQDRSLIEQSVSGLPWQVSEIEFENEIVFCIRKS